MMDKLGRSIGVDKFQELLAIQFGVLAVEQRTRNLSLSNQIQRLILSHSMHWKVFNSCLG